jgi:integrase
MSPFVVNALKEWKLQRPGVLVFGNGAGKVEALPNIWNRRLAPLEVAAGIVSGPKIGKEDGKPVVDKSGNPVMLAKYGLHAFRHFYASWRLEQGDNIKRVSERMGHSSPVVTLTLYSHLLPQEDEHERLAAGELALVG